MIRIVFLIVLFVFNVWGLYRSIRLWINPSDAIKALEEMSDKEIRLSGITLTIIIAVVYAVVFSLNSLIVPSKFVTVVLLIAAAFEVCAIFPRIHTITEVYSGPVKEMADKYLKNLKSRSSVINFLWNVAETILIGAAIYLILGALA